ncbi:D-glycerate dehydrogenase [Seohaeicola saemankumensis]|nr:D-glycerate dehydrogenase [Seohaeicola saemankumensis]MCA0869872.1 D-glycerate dehydrogenase [Seohaeicola saemankumensis]
MEHIATLTRPLPLPEIQVGAGTLRFLPVTGAAEVPAGTSVFGATALDPVNRATIEALPDSVRLIANIGVGYDNVDLEAAAERGIAVSNTPTVTEDTADLAFALILAACRRVGEGERFLRTGQWKDAQSAPPLGVRVHGQTLGLVGFGAISRAVARRARGFGMEILYTDLKQMPEVESEIGARYVASLHDMLAQSDIVSIHTVLTPATRNLIDAEALAAMRPGGVLVNAARGGIVDEVALCNALASGQLAAAALDVFDGEPCVRPELLACENVVLTPHIGSATDACRAEMVQCFIANVSRFVTQGVPLNPVLTPKIPALSISGGFSCRP